MIGYFIKRTDWLFFIDCDWLNKITFDPAEYMAAFDVPVGYKGVRK